MLLNIMVRVPFLITAAIRIFCSREIRKGIRRYLYLIFSAEFRIFQVASKVQFFRFCSGFSALVPRHIENDVDLFPHPMINKASRCIVNTVHLESPITFLCVLLFSLVRRLVIHDVRYTAWRGDFTFHLLITVVEIDVWHLIIVQFAVFSITEENDCNCQKQFSGKPLQRRSSLLFFILLDVLRALIVLKELDDCHSRCNSHNCRCCRVVDHKHSFCKHRIHEIPQEIHYYSQHFYSPFLFFSSVTL